MNCKATQKLLALHAGGDLPTRQARRVSRHLDSCGECRRLAAEFRASVTDSRASFVPEFDTDFFAGMRSKVLSQITSKPQTRSLFAFADRAALRRTTYACGVALAVVACLSALYVYFGQPNRPPSERGELSVAETHADKVTAKTSGDESPSDLIASHNPQPAATPERDEKSVAVRKALRPFRSLRSSTAGGDEIHAAQQSVGNGSSTAENLTASKTTDEASPGEAVASGRAEGGDINELTPDNAASVESAVTGAEMLRIEIQTSDPTLRIIWLSPKNQTAPPVKTDAQGS